MLCGKYDNNGVPPTRTLQKSQNFPHPKNHRKQQATWQLIQRIGGLVSFDTKKFLNLGQF